MLHNSRQTTRESNRFHKKSTNNTYCEGMIIQSMKKSWLLLFLLIIFLSISGCSTTSTSFTTSTTQNSIRSENMEIAHANFCFVADGSDRFDPPLVQDNYNGWVHSGRVRMPIEPGKYKITATTSTPEASISVKVDYRKFMRYDKFGIPLYDDMFDFAGGGKSDRFSDYNGEVLLPDGSIEGNITIASNPTGYNSPKCGTIIVTRLMV